MCVDIFGSKLGDSHRRERIPKTAFSLPKNLNKNVVSGPSPNLRSRSHGIDRILRTTRDCSESLRCSEDISTIVDILKN